MTRRDRVWFAVEVHYWECPKVLRMGDNAAVLFQQMLAYGRRHPELHGEIPDAAVGQMRHAGELPKLVEAEWVRVDQDAVTIADWPKWNQTTEQIEARRIADRDRKRAARRAAESSDDSACKEDQNQEQEQDKEKGTSADTSADSPRTVLRTSPQSPPGFDHFWSQYPRKVGKPKALAAYRSALTRATEQQIVEGLTRHMPTWSTTDPKFIPYPTTWLNRDGWNDQPAPMSGPTAAVIDLAAQAARLESGVRFF